MENSHLRRTDREINDRLELIEILEQNQIFSLAMASENQPYLVTMDYVYEQQEHSLFFHCASEGKKRSYMERNPLVWGQVMEDLGYETGECNHAYRSVHFKGKVSFLTETNTKREALQKLIEKFEPNPEPMFSRFLTSSSVDNVCVGKIEILQMTGKAYLKEQPRKRQVLQDIDCIRIPVDNLEKGLQYYQQSLGLEIIWRTDTAIGLRLPEDHSEIVIHTESHPLEVDFSVKSVEKSVEKIKEAAGKIIVEPFDIDIGKCAVVQDPWQNQYVILDKTKGTYLTDENDEVISVGEKKE